MADAPTTTASLSLDQTAYDLMVYKPLRAELYYDAVADVQPTRQSMRGAAVVFSLATEMAVATTALNESVDVDAVAIANSQVTLTLSEYGNAAITTAKVRMVSFVEIDPIVADLIAYNAGISQDSLAMNVIQAGTNVRYATGGTTLPTARNTVEPGDTLAARDARRAFAELVGANVPKLGNGYYGAFIHPDVAYDFRGETGSAAWRDPWDDFAQDCMRSESLVAA